MFFNEQLQVAHLKHSACKGLPPAFKKTPLEEDININKLEGKSRGLEESEHLRDESIASSASAQLGLRRPGGARTGFRDRRSN